MQFLKIETTTHGYINMVHTNPPHHNTKAENQNTKIHLHTHPSPLHLDVALQNLHTLKDI
jgi:hypothetical protein